MPSSQIEPNFVDYVSTYDSQESLDDIDRLIDATLDAPDNPALGNFNVPLALVENSSAVYGRLPKDSESRYERYGGEGIGFALGPMPPRAFLETFCPCPADLMEKMPPSKDAFQELPRAPDAEEELYEPLVVALNGTDGHARCPGHTFLNTSANPDTKGNCIVKPDVLCYANEHVPRVRINNSTSRTDMGFATFFIEVKCRTTQDFFQDPYEHWRSSRAQPCHLFRHATKKSRFLEEFGQQVIYATELCARQFRLCCFSVALFGCKARIMRWDRSGLIVTRQFDLHDNPEILCEFVWRYAHMSEAQRGMDMTVTVASNAEETLFRIAIESHVMLQLGLSRDRLQAAVYRHYQPKAVCAISVFDVTTREEQRYLISRPLTSPLSMIGRATRTYWAVNARTGRVACLKDTWRICAPGAEQEGAVIASLAAGGARNIPAVLHHGDVLAVVDTNQSASFDCAAKQTTLTDRFVDEKWVCEEEIDLSAVVKYTQYRLVVSIAGYALHSVSGTAELLPAGCRILQAMIDASNKKRVHRNIHPSSIVLYREKAGEDRHAFLLDWDLSWSIRKTNPHAHLPFDAMWQFMSISVQTNKGHGHLHLIQDDMESLLYVLLYCSLRWLQHTVDPSLGTLPWILDEMFDRASWCQGKPHGADAKYTNAIDRRYTSAVRFGSNALHKWLNQLMDFHHPPAEDTSDMRLLSPEPQLSTTAQWLNPKSLEEIWTRFLKDEYLERNDRVVRTFPHESREIEEDGAGHPATSPSYSRSAKRDVDKLNEDASGSEDEPTRPGKKQKASPSGDRYSRAATSLNTGTLERITALTIPQDDAELEAPSTSAVASARKKSPKRHWTQAKKGEGSKTKRK
ncbi:hypothetical protein ONZ51_g8607 [Trametes cubensis]|uniref:Fungal-type protein kinase domain-containing protein n=1 Tax=Trametes cubensis TaxID=1111947 RepID=A0AAD7X8I6_9APHY|nr:hypothetical protein ONZ51_g8607 [Trametes cubensis]